MYRTDRIREELRDIGIKNIRTIHYNLPTPALYEESIKRGEGLLSHLGPLVVRTGQHTGRSPNDKLIVKEPTSENNIWWSETNRPIDQAKFDRIFEKMKAYIQNKELYVQDCYAGADPNYTLPIRVINESAWHDMFARNIFIQIRYDEELLKTHKPEFTVINMPNFYADPEIDGTNSEVFIIVNFGKRLVLIGGTSYAGEMKKAIFSVLTYLLPHKDVLSMHCAANLGTKKDVAIFFGLSGTGKTALSADPSRKLIGDDEHGWSEKGVFNLEGGCYAIVFKLSRDDEPDIYDTTRKFGTILENVYINSETRRVDLDDGSLTENTRAAYPITHIDNVVRDGVAGHPRHIIMLTADAFGVIPPIARLTSDQAMYHFISGYTAKVGGTEKGITEPKAVFSTCYGAPFMSLHPSVYARLLGDKIKKHNVTCWLLNTGWTGGPYGEGNRMDIKLTRTMLNAALNGELDNVETRIDPYFGIRVPVTCPGVPSEILDPGRTWNDQAKYDRTARELVRMFDENFKQFDSAGLEEIHKSGPIIQ
jgi:phosphoenolpyruvate carboxykinase (ATP)